MRRCICSVQGRWSASSFPLSWPNSRKGQSDNKQASTATARYPIKYGRSALSHWQIYPFLEQGVTGLIDLTPWSVTDTTAGVLHIQRHPFFFSFSYMVFGIFSFVSFWSFQCVADLTKIWLIQSIYAVSFIDCLSVRSSACQPELSTCHAVLLQFF